MFYRGEGRLEFPNATTAQPWMSGRELMNGCMDFYSKTLLVRMIFIDFFFPGQEDRIIGFLMGKGNNFY